MRQGEAVAVEAPREPPLVLVGESPAARRLADAIRSAAAARCVLLEGEGGLDAVEIARAIHIQSTRRPRFVAVDCAAADPGLVERDVFGDQCRRTAGDLEVITPASALARANGGTLYLGEIAELSAAAQARLARVARDGEVRLSGGVVPLDVCVIASTSTDPESDLEEGRLRRDLLRRFSRARIALPALRRRAEDIPAMVNALIARLCTEAGAARKTLTQPAMTLLAAMPWKGNLVELRRAISRLVSDVAADVIELEDVLAHVRFDGALAPQAPAGTLRAARLQFERDYIALVLQHHRGRVGDAARALGIQRTNLYRKARQLGISVARPVQQP